MSRNRIVINGMASEIEGNDVLVLNGTVYVDGIPVRTGMSGEVHIFWHGDLATLSADGSVNCQDVCGDVSSASFVHCRDVAGRITAGGSVSVQPSVSTASVGGGNASAQCASASLRVRQGQINTGTADSLSRIGRHGNINAGGSVFIS